MPQIVDLTNPQGKYGGTFNAIAGILDTIGKVERLRQERALNAKVINAVAMGGGTVGPQQIAEILSQNQPQYSTGTAGLLQKIASQFAPPSQIQAYMGQGLMQQALQDPLDREYKQAQIEATNALTEQRLLPEQESTTVQEVEDPENPGKYIKASIGSKSGKIIKRHGSVKPPSATEQLKQKEYDYLQRLAPEERDAILMERLRPGPTTSVQVGVKMPPSGMLDKLSLYYEFESKLGDIGKLFASPGVSDTLGAFTGRWEQLKETYNIPFAEKPTTNEIMFRQMTGMVADDLLRMKSGAAINESEYARLIKLMPDFKQKPETFQPKFEGLLRAIRHTIEGKKRALREAGYIVPGETPLPSRQAPVSSPSGQVGNNQPADKQAFLNEVSRLNASDNKAAQEYYKKWIDTFDWNNK